MVRAILAGGGRHLQGACAVHDQEGEKPTEATVAEAKSGNFSVGVSIKILIQTYDKLSLYFYT